MNDQHGSLISNSISPVTPHGDSILEEPIEREELAQEEMMENKEVAPVPESHEETRQPRVGRRPMAPTKAEIEEHYPLHLNYRSWCEHCRARKGKARSASRGAAR